MFGRGERDDDDDQKWIEESVAKMRSEKHRDELRKLTTNLVVALVASGKVDLEDRAALRAAVSEAGRAARDISRDVMELIQ